MPMPVRDPPGSRRCKFPQIWCGWLTRSVRDWRYAYRNQGAYTTDYPCGEVVQWTAQSKTHGDILVAAPIKSAELLDMASSLEANGFERNQATTTVRAIADSIEMFAVTPTVLAQELGSTEQRIVAETDRRFVEQNAVWDVRFNDLTSNVDRRFAEQNTVWDARFDDLTSNVDRRFAEQNTVWDARFDDLKSDVDRRFAEQNAMWDARFDDFKSDVDRRFAEQNATWDTRFSNLKSDMVRQFAHQQASALEQYNDLKKEIRAVGTRQFVMMWGMVAIVVGAGVSDYVKQLFS